MLCVQADLKAPLPLADAAFDRVLCHNVLEVLPDPGALVAEAVRVLRPGGRLVLAHSDFDTLIFASEDLELTRRLVRDYCDIQQPWMDAPVSISMERQQFGGHRADRDYMFPRAARVFVAAELLLGIAYFRLPDSRLRAVVYCALGLGMVVAVVVGTRLNSALAAPGLVPPGRRPALFTVGDAINYT